MRIIHLSDTHTQEKRIEIVPCDLLIHTGDFCNINFNHNREKDNEDTFIQAMKFLDWIEVYPARYKIITSGNHETFLNDPNLRLKFETICNEKKIKFKDNMNEIIEIEGFKIAGAGSYPVIANYMTLKHAYSPNKGFYNQIPDEHIDILLSHVPPEVSGNQFECPDLEYWLRDRIKDQKIVPLILCGHIHEARGVYKINNEMTIANSSCEMKPKLFNLSKKSQTM